MMIERLKKYIMPFVLICLIPQIANILTCLIMSEKQLREIPSAVYLGDNTAVTRAIVKSFEDHETFDIKYFVEDPNEIRELMERGKIFFGLVIPQNFTKDMTNLKSPSLMTVIDGTQLSAASFVRLSSTEILLDIKNDTLVNLMRGKFNMSFEQAENAARAMDITSRILGNPTRNYINFLMPGMIMAMVQAGIGMAASAAINKEKRTNLFTYITLKILAYSVLGLASIAMILGVQIGFFDLPMKASSGKILLLCGAFSFCVASIGIMLSAIFPNKILASQAAAVYFLPSSILAGYTWPILSMPVFFQKLAFFLPFTHFGDTLRDLLLQGSSGFYYSHIKALLGMAVTAIALTMTIQLFREYLLRKEGKPLEADGRN